LKDLRRGNVHRRSIMIRQVNNTRTRIRRSLGIVVLVDVVPVVSMHWIELQATSLQPSSAYLEMPRLVHVDAGLVTGHLSLNRVVEVQPLSCVGCSHGIYNPLVNSGVNVAGVRHENSLRVHQKSQQTAYSTMYPCVRTSHSMTGPRSIPAVLSGTSKEP
jgi:hypothetical protein